MYRVSKQTGAHRLVMPILLLVVTLTAAACGGSTGSGAGAGRAAGSREGGTLTVLEGSGFAGAWPSGLDPATDPSGEANQSYLDAIYGQLFEIAGHGKIIDDLAAGYSLSNGGKTVTIDIRPGMRFTDGTPFNSQAVVWNIKRDLKSTCTCKPSWPVTSVTAAGTYAFKISLSRVFAPIISSFIDSTVNWIASPTSVRKMGEREFSLKPVGAGPFEVVSNTPSSVLILKKNPHYWQGGHPYLSRLIFKSVSSDDAAYEAMLAGEGQVYEDMSTPSLLAQAKQHFTVVTQLSTAPYVLQLNTSIPPFNNIKAREALYYATDFGPILSHIFDNLYQPTESFTGPGGICYQPRVPGYRTYDLARAKALVKQIGGLKLNLGTINVLVAKETTEALQTEWAKAGIKASISSYDLASVIQQFTSQKWQAMIQTAGAYDPADGVGVGFRFSSTAPFSGVHDPKLDAMLNAAAGTLNMSTRCGLYAKAASYISQHAYAPFFFSFAPANIAARGVSGPGLTSALPSVAVTPNIPWEDVSYRPAG